MTEQKIKILFYPSFRGLNEEEQKLYLNMQYGFIPPDPVVIRENWVTVYEESTEEEFTGILESDQSSIIKLTFRFFTDNQNPLATIEGQEMIRELGITHTTMSCGDALIVGDTIYYLRNDGWIKVEERKPETKEYSFEVDTVEKWEVTCRYSETITLPANWTEEQVREEISKKIKAGGISYYKWEPGTDEVVEVSFSDLTEEQSAESS